MNEMTEQEFLAALTTQPQHQVTIFIKLGGDPDDHNYARLSFLTRSLRSKGVKIESSRRHGVWLPVAGEAESEEEAA